MSTIALPRSPWRLGRATAVGLVALVSVVTNADVVWGRGPGGRGPTVVAGLAATVLLVCGDAGLVLAAVCASERWPMTGRRRLRRLGSHVAAAAATSGLVALAAGGAHALVPWAGVPFTPATALQHVPGYVVVLVFTHVLLLVRRLGRVRAARARLGQSLARAGRAQASAELRAIKAELHPMLVTGALDAARGLVRDDPAAAERVVVSLGALMREAVAAADVEEVTLGEELDAALERAGGAVGATEDVAAPFAVDVEPAARDLLVPHLVLPALLACAADAGADVRVLTVRAHTVRGEWEQRLVLAVTGPPDPRVTARGGRAGDASLGPSPSPSAGASPGMLALRRRLHPLYGTAAQLTLHAAGQSGTGHAGAGGPAVRLTLPGRHDDAPPARPEPAAGTVRAVADRRGRALEAWVVDAAGEGPPGPLSADEWFADVWLAAALATGLTALHWREAALAVGGWGTRPALVRAGVYAASLVVVAAAAVVTTRRWPIGADDRVGRAVRVHAAVGAGVAVLSTAVRLAAGWAAGLDRGLTPGVVALRVVATWVIYAMFAAVAHVVVLGGERRRGARVAGQLRAARADRARGRVVSELRALKAELNPHFVGNALHTAAALVRQDPDAAVHLLGALGTLADAAGAHVDTQETSLADEVMGLEPFLALERARLGASGGTLAVTWDVAPDVLDAAVPHLVLQPLAENAVRHGLAPRGGAGRLVVAARRAGTRVELSVADDGVGLRPRRTGEPVAGTVAGTVAGVVGGVGSGAGLGGVRRRLALLYGTDARCVLEGGPGGGAVARLTFPYRSVVTPGDMPESLAAGG